jgi:hypothetical protein
MNTNTPAFLSVFAADFSQAMRCASLFAMCREGRRGRRDGAIDAGVSGSAIVPINCPLCVAQSDSVRRRVKRPQFACHRRDR